MDFFSLTYNSVFYYRCAHWKQDVLVISTRFTMCATSVHSKSVLHTVGEIRRVCKSYQNFDLENNYKIIFLFLVKWSLFITINKKFTQIIFLFTFSLFFIKFYFVYYFLSKSKVISKNKGFLKESPFSYIQRGKEGPNRCIHSNYIYLDFKFVCCMGETLSFLED